MTVCALCHDTGSLSKTVRGSLDCAYCDVANQRMDQERWYMNIVWPMQLSVLDLMWLVVLREREIQQGEKE